VTREEADSGIIMDMDKSEKKKSGEKEGKRVGDESVFKQRVLKLTEDGDAGGLEELHEKGGWPDVEMAVGSGNGENTWHFTALAFAATYNQLEVVRVLIKMGAKVNEEREWYHLPSCLAAAEGHLEMLELLVKNGCDLGLGDCDGMTPAHCAAQNNHLHILHFLHSSGAPMHTKNNKGETPADLTTLQGHTECAKFLLNEAMPIGQRIKKHIETGEVHTLRRLHSEKVWLDGEVVVDSYKKESGNIWHYSALAYAAGQKQLGVMSWLIEIGVEMDEMRS
jgi:ankyrin repeat protein